MIEPLPVEQSPAEDDGHRRLREQLREDVASVRGGEEPATLDTSTSMAILAVFGGDGSLSIKREMNLFVESDEAEQSNLTLGVTAQVDFPLNAYFTVGPLFRYTHARLASSLDTFDAALNPRLRVVLPVGEMWIAPFVQVPLGISVIDYEAQAGVAPAFMINPSAGLELFFIEQVGFHVDIGWLRHQFATSNEATSTETSYVLSQVIVQFGVVCAPWSEVE